MERLSLTKSENPTPLLLPLLNPRDPDVPPAMESLDPNTDHSHAEQMAVQLLSTNSRYVVDLTKTNSKMQTGHAGYMEGTDQAQGGRIK